ncbi:MAG: hypothetical protein HQL82_15890 [Magnetococcales bacterium]|nr:hypothetical protein [Magnetococcales bacterium]
MANFIGLKNSSFDPVAHAALTQENTGPDAITTGDFQQGWQAIKEAALSDEFIKLVKSSPLFVSEKACSAN